MIEIKSFFTDWHEVDREQAKEFVKNFMNGATALPCAKKVEYVEENRLRGITVKELFNDDEDMLNLLEQWNAMPIKCKKRI